jgi:hypothetical protein
MINESKQMSIKLLRRAGELEKIGDSIEFQTEVQDPCNFDDSEEYADFCIGQGVSFYYCDEDYCDDEDYAEPSEEMVEVRDEVEEYLQEKYYGYLVDIYNDTSKDCE